MSSKWGAKWVVWAASVGDPSALVLVAGARAISSGPGRWGGRDDGQDLFTGERVPVREEEDGVYS